jgi:hypothetical protein
LLSILRHPSTVDLAAARDSDRVPRGRWTRLDGEPFYQITDAHRMPPFLMSIPSDSDLWMFISSCGGLTAGRVDAAGSLFPYETVDKLHDGHHHTGPITLLRVRLGPATTVLWQPFTTVLADHEPIERNLYKHAIGHQVVFEEMHHELGLRFRYR